MTNTADNLLSRLAAIPGRIAQAIAQSNDEDISQYPSQGEWSIAEILAHLRVADDIYAPRAYAVVMRDNPSLLVYDDRRWAELTGHAQSDFRTSLELFTLKRAEFVRYLHNLAESDWQRSGVRTYLPARHSDGID